MLQNPATSTSDRGAAEAGQCPAGGVRLEERQRCQLRVSSPQSGFVQAKHSESIAAFCDTAEKTDEGHRDRWGQRVIREKDRPRHLSTGLRLQASLAGRLYGPQDSFGRNLCRGRLVGLERRVVQAHIGGIMQVKLRRAGTK